jgi:hypothetical protein
VTEIERDMPIAEYVDWQRFANQHPLPADLADIHNGMLMSLMANAWAGKGSPTYAPKDFFVLGRAQEKRVEPRTIAERMRAVMKQ